MQTEIWKPVKGYEGLYEVSSLGRVKSLSYKCTGVEKILKPNRQRNGYLGVCLRRYGKVKRFLIHRLVAIAFLPNPYDFEQINHKNEDKANNCVENIEWCSRRYNMRYGSRTKRQAASKSKAVEASRFPDFRTIELRFVSVKETGINGYDQSAVSKCCRGCYSTNRGNFYKNLYWRYCGRI